MLQDVLRELTQQPNLVILKKIVRLVLLRRIQLVIGGPIRSISFIPLVVLQTVITKLLVMIQQRFVQLELRELSRTCVIVPRILSVLSVTIPEQNKKPIIDVPLEICQNVLKASTLVQIQKFFVLL